MTDPTWMRTLPANLDPADPRPACENDYWVCLCWVDHQYQFCATEWISTSSVPEDLSWSYMLSVARLTAMNGPMQPLYRASFFSQWCGADIQGVAQGGSQQCRVNIFLSPPSGAAVSGAVLCKCVLSFKKSKLCPLTESMATVVKEKKIGSFSKPPLSLLLSLDELSREGKTSRLSPASSLMPLGLFVFPVIHPLCHFPRNLKHPWLPVPPGQGPLHK